MAPCGCPRLRPGLAAWGWFGALALWAAVAAWAGDGPPERGGLRALRDAGWACLDRGDTEGALRAAARMLQIQPGCDDALLLEGRAHLARLAAAPTGETPIASSFSDQVRREGAPSAKTASDRLDGLIRAAGAAHDRQFPLDQPISVNLVETPLPEAVRRLSEAAGLPIRLAPDAATSTAPITLRGTNLPLDAALRWVERLSGLHYVLRDHAVVFTARPGEAGEIVRQTYDLQGLMPPPKGAAPRPDASGDGWARYIRATVAPGTWAETDQEAESGPHLRGGPLRRDVALNALFANGVRSTEHGVAAVLQERNLNAIAYRGGRLVVVHTPEVQQQVADLLDMFRRERNLLVHIQCRFLILSHAFLSSLGVDYTFDSLLGPTDHSRTVFSVTNNTQLGASTRITDVTASGGLSLTYNILNQHSLSALLTAVIKKREGTVLQAPRITCLNTQRAILQVVINHNYIRRVTGDDQPEIGNIPEGMIFDVQPFVSADRRYITLNLQPQQRVLLSLVDYTFLTRTSQTTGTISVLAPSGVTIQVPTTQLRSVGTTVTVPNGGTLLVAGFAEVESASAVATLPGVENVPFLRYILRRADEIQGRRSLVILVTAQTVPDTFAE